MSWNIAVYTNTLRMNEETANRLIDKADEHDFLISYSEERGIEFDYDAMEFMDFLWHDWALDVLSDYSVNGDVVFGSLEGDNRGNFWGYRFRDGEMVNLTGSVKITEEY